MASPRTTHDARVNGDSSETVELLSTIVYTEDIALFYQLVQKINTREVERERCVDWLLYMLKNNRLGRWLLVGARPSTYLVQRSTWVIRKNYEYAIQVVGKHVGKDLCRYLSGRFTVNCVLSTEPFFDDYTACRFVSRGKCCQNVAVDTAGFRYRYQTLREYQTSDSVMSTIGG